MHLEQKLALIICNKLTVQIRRVVTRCQLTYGCINNIYHRIAQTLFTITASQATDCNSLFIENLDELQS
jgi:hypothetical protein